MDLFPDHLAPKTPQLAIPVLIPLALDQTYHYLIPEKMTLKVGDFVTVPLGSRKRHGVVWGEPCAVETLDFDAKKLRKIIKHHDLPPLQAEARRLIEWVARYTLAPKGMVLKMMMSAPAAFEPPKVRMGYNLTEIRPKRMTDARLRVVDMATFGAMHSKGELAQLSDVSTSVVDGLVKAGTLEETPLPEVIPPQPDPDFQEMTFSPAQKSATTLLCENAEKDSFTVSLLDGVTGCGKTEIYFEAIATVLRKNKQALVLLPEIALTGQFLKRFEKRFGTYPGSWHSAMTPAERSRVWRMTANGSLKVIFGARSGLFLPFKALGLIIIDEEHESAYKQDDQVRYQARDIAVVRSMIEKIPTVLSSATPSLESWVNAKSGKYTHIKVTERYAKAELPDIRAIDLRENPPEKGRWMSPILVEEITNTLAKGEQSLLFLNRRGYAPLTLCRKCGHRFECPECSAWLVEHRYKKALCCHLCGFATPVPTICPSCEAEESLVPCGPGVERIAEELTQRFPDAKSAILSSDLVSNIQEQRAMLEDIALGKYDLIVGTQLVAKGHHFPFLSLVGVIDGDLGMAQADPRAAERSYQLLTQVTGRAGREKTKGIGLIQTYMPENTVMKSLLSADRDTFLQAEKEMRRMGGLPPFGRLAAFIFSADSRSDVSAFAYHFTKYAPISDRIRILGPVEAPMAVIRNRHRARVLLKADKDIDLQSYIRTWLKNAPKPNGSLKLVVDIDPYNFF